jgi:hypothetical protein
MNSTVKTSAKISEELNQSNETSDTQKEDVQHIKARLGKMGNKVMLRQYIGSMDRQLITKKICFCGFRGEMGKEE